MTKILLIEKRYDGTKAKPLITAEWVEVPDGEEKLFLEKQLSYAGEIKPLKLDGVTHKFKQRLSPEDIVTIFSVLALIIAVPIAYYIYHLVPQS